MSKIIDIINEYENWLQKRLDNFEGENLCNRLVEEGGTNYDDFEIIYDTILASFNYADKEEENGKVVLYNKTPVENAFLHDITYKIIYDHYPENAGAYVINSGKYNKKDNKLYNARFIFAEKDLLYPKIGSSSFNQIVWHELQHAYVRYNVLKKLSQQEIDNNIKINSRNDFNDKMQKDIKLHDNIKDIFYYTDTDEINSHLNEMIPYLQEHNEINFINYKEYLNDIPGYFLLNKLKEMYKWLEIGLKTHSDFRNYFVKIVNEKYKDLPKYKGKTISTKRCVYMILNRLSNATIYMQRQFYKILTYTLKKLGRTQRYNEMYHAYRPKKQTSEEFEKSWKEILKNFG